MLRLWNSVQKNGEAKKSTPLLLLCMSCSSSLAGFYGLLLQSQVCRISAPIAVLNTKQAFISPLDSNESKRENSAREC